MPLSFEEEIRAIATHYLNGANTVYPRSFVIEKIVDFDEINSEVSETSNGAYYSSEGEQKAQQALNELRDQLQKSVETADKVSTDALEAEKKDAQTGSKPSSSFADEMRKKAQKLKDDFETHVDATTNTIIKIGETFPASQEIIKSGWDKAAQIFTNALDAIVGIFNKIAEGVLWLVDKVKQAWNAVKNWVSDTWHKLFG